MPRPGFGDQPFGTSRFGGGARDIRIRWGRLRARTLKGRVIPQ